MVAKVNAGKNIRAILNYNENKVREGVATCIHENLFGQHVNTLTFTTKLNGFENFLNRNQRATTKAVHISLNFHASETLSTNTLREIASTYMDKIGFGNQPYLVYQHKDAAHPHIHIVTTNITQNGKRILLYNIGKNQSEKARKEVEKDFHLVRAEDKTKSKNLVHPIDVHRAQYGKSETKRSIASAVLLVTKNYKFSSLPEFNAVLRQFNVVADRGTEKMQMYKKKGLLYSLLNDQGNKVGIPIKASSLYYKPTLPNLERQFKTNDLLKQPHKERLRTCIDKCLRDSKSTADFGKALHGESIYVLLRQAADGRTYGITFVDNKSQTVFNGSNLGKGYTAKAILEQMSDTSFKGGSINTSPPDTEITQPQKFIELNLGAADLIKDLVTAEQHDFTSPDAAIKKRKKKKRKHL